jgi:hypothetical protein
MKRFVPHTAPRRPITAIGLNAILLNRGANGRNRTIIAILSGTDRGGAAKLENSE